MIATISSIRSLSTRVKAFELQLPEAVSFEAGQFVILKAEIRGEVIERSYSIANAVAATTNTLELCIALNPSGKMTPFLFEVEQGEVLEISLPQGGFVLRQDSRTLPTVFVCTGTGVAPFRSMIAQRLADGDTEPIYLVMGNRFVDDMLYHADWMSLAETNPRFRYVNTLSKGAPMGNSMKQGYVHEHYAEIISNHRDVHVYVCGWEVMCKEARQRLKEMGLTRRQYFFEQYDG